MQITEVRVRLMDSPKMRAVASVTFDGCFVVHDIKIIDGQNGMFIAMPSRKMADGGHRDIAHPLNLFTRDMIKEVVFDAYDRALREEMNKSDEDAERTAAKFF
jgi:stage V sporulation protein G